MNDPVDPADESVDAPDAPERSADAEAAGAPTDPAAPEADGRPGAAPTEPADTSIYVRHGRTPTLGFWVALAIAIPAVAALISSPFFNFPDLGAVVNFVLLAATLVGVPLAAIAAVIDAVRHRGPTSRRR